jgi:hypothetical protein
MLDGTAIGGKRKFALPKVCQWAACIDDGHSPNLISESTTEVFEMVIQGPSVSKIDEFGAQRKIVFDQASSQGTASERVIFYRGWMDHSNPLSTPRSRTQAPHDLSCTMSYICPTLAALAGSMHRVYTRYAGTFTAQQALCVP